VIPTKGQADAIAMAKRLTEWTGSPRVGVLAGVAGTGKTTCLRMVAEEIGYPLIVTPTGKASIRVREATGLQASTIHSWMYHPDENEQTGEVSFSKKTPTEIDRGEAGLLIVDEGSMVDEDLWDDIYDVCSMVQLNILAVGDPFQLEPVKQRDTDGEPFNLMSPRVPRG
jgi:exodeoxyribonuclease V alpha subunit